jgi:hypothetical protein
VAPPPEKVVLPPEVVAAPPKKLAAPIIASPHDHEALLEDMHPKPAGSGIFRAVPRAVVTAASLTVVSALLIKLLGDGTVINGLLSVLLAWRLLKRMGATIRRKWRGEKDRPPSDANRAPDLRADQNAAGALRGLSWTAARKVGRSPSAPEADLMPSVS